jgi:diguanylate cyclase (GGDEF)-like protein
MVISAITYKPVPLFSAHKKQDQWQPIADNFEHMVQQPETAVKPDSLAALYNKVKQWRTDMLHKLDDQQSELKHLRKTALTDPLTGLANRRFFDGELERTFAQAQRDKHPMSLILLDIDKLKTINDQFGHEGGDLMLTLLANSLKGQVRVNERLSRIGGEEFALVMENAPPEEALAVAKRLNQKIGSLFSSQEWKHYLPSLTPDEAALAETILKKHGLTTSAGVASYSPKTDASVIKNHKQLYSLADTGLYLCKAAPIKNPWIPLDTWKDLKASRNRVYAMQVDTSTGKVKAELGYVGKNSEERGVQTK